MASTWTRTWMDNRPLENKPPHRSIGHLCWFVICFFTISAGVMTWFIGTRHFLDNTSKEVENQSTTRDSKDKHIDPPRVEKTKLLSASLSPKTMEKSPEDNPEKVMGEKWLGVEIDHKTITTNGQYILETIFTTDGKMHRYAHSARPRIFNNASDQILSLATSDSDGTTPLPGLGKNFEEEFVKSLKTEIVINSDDSPEVRKIKENVILARKNLLDAIQEGHSAEEVIQMDREAKLQSTELRNVAVRGLRVYLDKGDEEGAAIYLEKMNQKLEEMGLMKLELPRKRGK